MPKDARLMVAIAAACVMSGPARVLAADPPSADAPVPPAATPAAAPADAQTITPSTEAIEAAIGNLTYPVPDEEIVAILNAIGQLQDQDEQDRLRQALNDKGHELGQQAALPPSNGPTLTPESSDEEFRSRIGAMQLGLDATVTDLRDRDEVVSAIVGITDPTRRDELLEALEQRERDADTLIEAPKPR